MFEKSSAFVRAPKTGDGHIYIDPWSWEITAGSWTHSNEVVSTGFSFIYNSSFAQGDKIQTKAFFARGLWKMFMQVTRFQNYGRFNLNVGGETIYTGDLYSSTVQNNVFLSKTFSVANPSLKTVEIETISKNELSLGNHHVHFRLSFQRLDYG